MLRLNTGGQINRIMPAFAIYRVRLVTEWKREAAAAVENVRNFDMPYTLHCCNQCCLSPPAGTGVINYYFRFLHWMTPLFIPTVVTNLIYYSSSSTMLLIIVKYWCVINYTLVSIQIVVLVNWSARPTLSPKISLMIWKMWLVAMTTDLRVLKGMHIKSP